MIKNPGIWVMIWLLTTFQSLASEPQPKAVQLDNTEQQLLHSTLLDRDFNLMIARPFGPPAAPGNGYPVIYLLDADIAFPMVRQIAMSLQSGLGLPPVLIVGIGYPGGFREAMMRRTYDYTPSADEKYARFAARWEPGGGQGGGAPKLLDFIRDELKPFINENYNADAEDATLFGSSFGGLFAAYALLEKPDTFQRYVLSSPSLWWNDNAIFEKAKQFAAKTHNPSAQVFIAAGGRETKEHEAKMLARAPAPMRQSMQDFEEALGDQAQMAELIEPFANLLRSDGHPGLSVTTHIFPDDTHFSTPPMAITRGLRVVFQTF